MIKLKKDPRFDEMLKKALDKKTYEKMIKELGNAIFKDMHNYTSSVFGVNSWITKQMTKENDSLEVKIDTGKDTDRYFHGGWHYPIKNGNDTGKYFVIPLQGQRYRKINNFLGKHQFYARYRGGRTLIVERISKTVTISRYIMYDKIFLKRKWNIKEKFEDSFKRNSGKIMKSYEERIL